MEIERSVIDCMAKEEQYQQVANKKDLKEGALLKIEPNGKINVTISN